MQFGTTKSGKPSAKMINGMGWRKYLKLRLIAIYEAQCFSDTEIAFALQITPQYVRMLKNTPEYVGAKVAAATNTLTKAEKDSLDTLEARRQAIADMVPDALQVIRDTLINGNQALRFKAAQDILARQGDHAIVSRTEISLPQTENLEQHEKRVGNLLAALQQINAPKQQEQAEKLETSEEIQGVEEFVNTAINEDQQKMMHEAMELISKKIDKETNKSNYIN